MHSRGPDHHALQGNYEVTFGTTSLAIDAAPIDRVQVAPIEDCVYDGQPYHPEPALTYNGVALTKDKDYALSYGANTSPGQWQVHIAGKGNFSSNRDETFLIVKYDISKNYCNVVVPIQQYAGGEEVRPAPLYVEVHDRSGGKMRMTASTDYEVTGYRNNVEIGTGHLTIEGKGNYVGSCDGHFGIVNSNDLGLGVVADIPDHTYAAGPIEPMLTVYLEGIELLPLRDVDFTAEFKDNVKVGTATVTLTGINGMRGETQTTFKIVPKAATVTARDATKTYGDADPELAADVEGIIDGDEFAPTYELARQPGEDVGKYAIGATGDGLQGNYRLAYAGATFTVGPAQIMSADVAHVTDQVHTGSPIEPKPGVTFKGQALEEGRDYSLSYADNVDMGTAHMTIKGMGNFIGEQTLSFQIVGAEYSLKTGSEDSHVIGSGIPLEFSFTRADDDALTSTASWAPRWMGRSLRRDSTPRVVAAWS